MSASTTTKRVIHLFRSLVKSEIPGQLVIQITDRCNAQCPQCGMRVSEKYGRTRLEPDQIKRMIDAAANRGVQALSLTGGEPFLMQDELISLIKYAGQAGIPYIRTGTNGFLFMHPEKKDFDGRIKRLAENLASTPLRNLWISLDSALPAKHELMRGFPGIIKGIEKALPVFHEHGIYPSANLGINRNMGRNHDLDLETPGESGIRSGQESFYQTCQQAFQAFYQFVIDLEFTMVNSCYPMSFDAQETSGTLNAIYAANSAQHLVRFSPQEKAILFTAMFDTIPEFRSRIRIFSPRISLLVMSRDFLHKVQTQYPCHGGVDAFFISATDGNAYPCGFRGHENLGRYWALNHKPKSQARCYLCQWECFRDPSELFGPWLQLFHDPLGLVVKFARDKKYLGVWLEDLQYYHACHYFDGRRPPDFNRLRAYAK